MGNFLVDPTMFANAQRVARAFAESELVPEHMRGKLADCLVALHIANQMDEDPLMVMQSMYQVSGRPGWITAFMISRADKSGRFMDPIDWEIEGAGKDAKVIAVVQLRRADGTPGRTVRSPMVDMVMAKAEGWTRNKKYETMPELMFRYRSATLLIELYCPEVLYGYHTIEEIEDVAGTLKDVTPPRPTIDDFKPGAARKQQPGTTIEEPEPEAASADTPPAPQEPVDDALTDTANKVADQGSHAFRLWWRTLIKGDRDQLSGQLARLQMRAVEADESASADTPPLGAGVAVDGACAVPASSSQVPERAEAEADARLRASGGSGAPRTRGGLRENAENAAEAGGSPATDPPPAGGEAAGARGGQREPVADAAAGDAADREAVGAPDLSVTTSPAVIFTDDLAQRLTEAASKGLKHFDNYWIYAVTPEERALAAPWCGHYREIAHKAGG